ncbi:MAG TPA: type VI secretion system tip protein TssI/VgrG, partial [Candidatus Nanopelagicales bacterium]|nr:type VI secretion system tip protein TssI/VgrG [Candidatus Nanopelagicales bacterium]
ILWVSSGETDLDVRQFSVHEGISRLFDVRLQVVTSNLDIDLESIIGRPATFATFGRMAMPSPAALAAAAGATAGDLAGAPANVASLLGGAAEFLSNVNLTGLVDLVASIASRAASQLASGLVQQLVGQLGGLDALAGRLAGDLVDQSARRLLNDVLPPELSALPVQRLVEQLGQGAALAQSLPGLGASPAGAAPAVPSGEEAQEMLRAGRIWSGVCRAMRLESTEPDGLSLYSVLIAPTLWLLTQRRQNRVFQRKSAPEIAKEILSSWGIEPELRLDVESYPKLEYRAQYKETDYDFLARQLEDAGISYLFEQSPEGETRLVLAERPQAGVPVIPPLRYMASPPERSEAPHATQVRLTHELRPGRYTIRDYDPRRPNFELIGQAALLPEEAGVEALLEDFVYRPGISRALVAEDDGANTPVADAMGICRATQEACRKTAERRLEALRAGKRRVELLTNTFNLAAGSVFPLMGHPSRDLGSGGPKDLLVVNASFEGSAEGEWTARAMAVPAEDPYRPPREAGKRLIQGVQTATVVGPPGQDVHTDELAEVKVQFPWDRQGKLDDQSSPFLRVAQSWAGAGFGTISLPRVGQEVLTTFLEGDPDNPLVLAAVHNMVTPTPYQFPANKSRSTWKGDPIPKDVQRPAVNQIAFEDASRQEALEVVAARDMITEVARDQVEETKGHRRLYVKGDIRIQADGHIRITSGDGQDIDIRAGDGGLVTLNTTDEQVEAALQAGPQPAPVPQAPPEPTPEPTPPQEEQPAQPPAQQGRWRPAPRLSDVEAGRAQLQEGHQGPAVEELQRRLNRAGYPVEVDGKYGEQTREAVERFQIDKGIRPPSGIVGQTTLSHVTDSVQQASTGSLVYPVARNVPYGSPFGMRTHPISGERRMHNGQDFPAPRGSPVYASTAGRVTHARWNNGGFGNLVIIETTRNGQRFETYYAHLDSMSVSENQTVTAGQVIGQVGSTGRSTGPHLHYETRINGQPVNPRPLLGG